MKGYGTFLKMTVALFVVLTLVFAGAFAALAKDGKSTKKKPIKKVEKKETKKVEPQIESQGQPKQKQEQEQPKQEQPKTVEDKKSQKVVEEKTKKLEQIDREIAEANAQKKKGLIKIGAGLGLDLLSFLFAPSIELKPVQSSYLGYSYTDYEEKETGNAFLFYACLIAGTGFEIWGAYQWWDAAQTASQLKVKRYDIGLRPMIQPGSYALALQVNF